MKKRNFFEKGRVSNATSLVLLVAGLVFAERTVWGEWVLAAGLFGLAGGITNWLAVKMLFDRVPLLYGSGVIPNRFREIRQTVKDLIMVHFFDEEHLQRSLPTRSVPGRRAKSWSRCLQSCWSPRRATGSSGASWRRCRAHPPA